MNNQELVQRAIDQNQLPGVEEWKAPIDQPIERRINESQVNSCVAPSFPGLDPFWQTTTTNTIEVEKRPDFEVKVWKASNGFMIEVCGEKYIAKNSKEMAQLFLKAFDEGK